MRRLVSWLVCLGLLGCECAPDAGLDAAEAATPEEHSPRSEPAAEETQPLYVDPSSVDFASSPSLLPRLRESPHNYFRFVRSPFATEVCRRFASASHPAPRVNLHGDAHVEQYAVSDLGRGLTDFDGAAEGPAVIDLVRMGTSIRLTCEQHGWEDDRDTLMDTLLEGYRDGIRATEDAPPPEPGIVLRIRAEFSTDRTRLLENAERLAAPLSAEDTDAARRTLAPYVDSQLAADRTLDPRFFELVSIGRLDMGIGSALDEKYLLRVRGPTDRPGDDEILEAKQVGSVAEIPCVGGVGGAARDPFRILVGESRIAYRPFPYLGYVRLDREVFWIHGWTANYREISVTESLTSPEDLRELVRDIGQQLGRGHVNRIAAPLDDQLRQAMFAYLEETEPAIRDAVIELSGATRSAWERFVLATENHPEFSAGPAAPRPGAFTQKG